MLDGTKIHGGNINNLRYADDTALIANSEQKLQTIVDKVKEESAKHGLDMNVKKTKTMLISKHPEGKKIAVSQKLNIRYNLAHLRCYQNLPPRHQQ